MGRNRHRGRRRRRPGHFAQPDNDNNITMQDTWDDRDTGRGRTRNRRGQWQDNRRPELSPREVEELYADLEDDLIDDQPPVMYDPLEQIIKHHQQQNTRRQRNNNNNSNVHSPLFQQPSKFNHTPFQQRRQQLLHQPQQQQQQTLQRHPQRKDQHDCHDCRTARKANVRLRNALHSHIKAATATLAEWSTEVGVPFGGVADDEMDWQPEPEIRVVFVPQHQQYQQQGDRRRYYNDQYRHYHHHNGSGAGLSTIEYPSAPGARYVGYGGYGGYGAYAGHAGGTQGMSPSSSSITDGSIPTAPWWLESEIASLEESTEELTPPNESPEELYHHQQQPMALEPDPFKAPTAAPAPAPTRSYGSMTLEPDPFKAPTSGSGFAANTGANGYAGLRDALNSESARFQRKALNLTHYLLSESHSDCSVFAQMGFPRLMMRLASSDDSGVREAALGGLLELARDTTLGNRSLLADHDRLRRLLWGRIQSIRMMAREDLDAAREERQLVGSLWITCYHEPSTLHQDGLLVLPGEESYEQPPDVASRFFEPLRRGSVGRAQPNERSDPGNGTVGGMMLLLGPAPGSRSNSPE